MGSARLAQSEGRTEEEGSDRRKDLDNDTSQYLICLLVGVMLVSFLVAQ